MHDEFYVRFRATFFQVSLKLLILVIALICAFLAGRTSMFPKLKVAQNEIDSERTRANVAEDLYDDLFQQRLREHLDEVNRRQYQWPPERDRILKRVLGTSDD